LLSTAASFFFGWLVFSNVYFYHDYYQLPVVVSVFICLAVSMGAIHKEYFVAEKSKKVLSVFYTTISVLMIYSVLFLSIERGPRVSKWSAFEYALQKVYVVMLVTEVAMAQLKVG
jgi:hypothetical protein